MSVKRSVIALAAACAATVALHAQTVTVKLATVAPANSSWDKALLDMGAVWAKTTSNRVTLRVYQGGTQGDERTVIRMMRPGVDQLQASLLMVSGLGEIDDAFNVFGLPFFFQSDAEANYVREKLTPLFEKRLDGKGFKLLAWGSGGWVQLFSKMPIKTLDEVKSAKLYTSQGDDKMVQWYKSNGFNPVALSSNDIPAQLKLPTGMINATPMPPYPALVLQIFRDAKYMLDVRVAPLLGAVVMTNSAWGRISPDDRTAIQSAAKAFETRMISEAPAQDAASVKTMQSRGLTVTALDSKAAAEFRAAAERLTASARGTMVPEDVFTQAMAERDAFRKTKGK
jgi:TRAP-type C4-dicarboxylate transport system substrate-binding protein